MSNYSYIESLPLEVIISQILPELSLYDVIQLCQSSTVFNDLCENQYIWKILLQRDFPEIIEDLGPDWKRTYIDLVTKRIPIVLNGDVIRTTIIEFSGGQLGVQCVFPDVENIINDKVYMLIFLNKIYPIFIIDTQQDSYKFHMYNINNINKVLIIPSITLDRFIETLTPTKSSNVNRINPGNMQEIIYDNLFSPLGILRCMVY